MAVPDHSSERVFHQLAHGFQVYDTTTSGKIVFPHTPKTDSSAL